jgi:hypothetical protein
MVGKALAMQPATVGVTVDGDTTRLQNDLHGETQTAKIRCTKGLRGKPGFAW